MDLKEEIYKLNALLHAANREIEKLNKIVLKEQETVNNRAAYYRHRYQNDEDFRKKVKQASKLHYQKKKVVKAAKIKTTS